MPRKGHLIVPRSETIRLTPFHDVELVEVNLKPDDGHRMSGWGETADIMLSKPQVEELAAAVNISIIDPEEVVIPEGTPGRFNIVRMKVTVVAEGASGKERRITKTYDLDMRLKEVDGVDGSIIQQARMRKRDAELKAKKDKKHHYSNMPARDASQEEWDVWVEDQARREWMMKNRHRLSLAETGAALRAMRTMLNIKSTYKPHELAEPFWMVRSNIAFERAIMYGGPVGELALKTLGLSFMHQLGMSEEYIAGMLESVNLSTAPKIDGPKDLLPAEEEQIEQLIDDMVAAGFPNRAACDQRAMDMFDIPLSQFTVRHVGLVREYVELSGLAKSTLNTEDFAEYQEHILDVVRLAYATGSTIENEISMDMWNKIHGAIEMGDEDETGGDREYDVEGQAVDKAPESA